MEERLTSKITSRMSWSVMLLALYLACIYAVQPMFFSANNLWALMYYTCLVAPAVIGTHLLMLLGLFDLSIGAITALAAVVAAKLMLLGMPIWLAVILSLVVGLVAGALNWVLSEKLRIPVLIGTLITMGIARAFALGITEGQSLGGIPENFGTLALGNSTANISPAIILGLTLVILVEVFSKRHILFRRLYHVGNNVTAAASAGINVSQIKLFGFTAAGAGAAATGLMQCSRTLSASPFLFPDLALECITACVIGGAALKGGAGTSFGAFLGMFMVVMSRNLVVMAGISVYWKELGVALILLAAVLLKRAEEQ